MVQVRTLLGAYYWPVKGTSIRGCASRVKFLGRIRLRSDSLLSADERGGGGARHTGHASGPDFQCNPQGRVVVVVGGWWWWWEKKKEDQQSEFVNLRRSACSRTSRRTSRPWRRRPSRTRPPSRTSAHDCLRVLKEACLHGSRTSLYTRRFHPSLRNVDRKVGT